MEIKKNKKKHNTGVTETGAAEREREKERDLNIILL